MPRVSTTPETYTETYTVRFWYTNAEGFRRQHCKDFYSNSKSNHKAVKKYAEITLKKIYKNLEIISVVYN